MALIYGSNYQVYPRTTLCTCGGADAIYQVNVQHPSAKARDRWYEVSSPRLYCLDCFLLSLRNIHDTEQLRSIWL